MEIKLNVSVMLDASPALLSAISSIGAKQTPAADAPAETPAATEPPKKRVKEKPAPEVKQEEEKTVEAPAEPKKEETKAADNAAAPPSLTLQDIQKACQQKIDANGGAAARERIKNMIVEDFKVPDLRSMPADQYTSFLAHLENLFL